MDKKPLVFVVDDEMDLRDIMQYKFQAEGYDVETAVDGLDALQKIKNIEPDVIILDLNMPRLGGVQFFMNICNGKGEPKYPTIVLTARSNMESLFQMYKIERFMPKPFRLEELISTVQSVTNA